MKRLLWALASASLLMCRGATAQQVELDRSSVIQTVIKLRAGEYVWAPHIAPTGPMLLIVNLATQRAILFRNGVPIGATTVSTGRPGYRTPAGVFTILQKRAEHYSSTYDNAPMPYMQRLTWRGVALHAGQLPGYPASHGCIRLPRGFAQLLFGVTKLGMTVVITDHAITPRFAPTPEIALAPRAGGARADAKFEWAPERSQEVPVSILVSGADRRAIILRNGVVIGSGEVSVNGPVTGTWAYTLRNIDSQGQHWFRMELSAPSEEREVATKEWAQFNASEELRRAVAGIVTPGTTIIVTSDSLREGSEPVDVLQEEEEEEVQHKR